MTAHARLGSVRIAVAATLWGTWSLFFRPAEELSRISAALEAFVVFAAILIVTLPWALCARSAVRRPISSWLGIATLGVFDAMNALLFFSAMQHTSLPIAVLTHYLAPLLVAVAAPAVLGDRLRLATWGALATALCGLIFLLEPWRPLGSSWLGAGLGAASAIFFAANILIAKRIQHHFAPIELLTWHMPTALVTLAPFAFASGIPEIAPAALGLLGLGALGPGALAGALFVGGLVRVDATRASVLMLLEPVSAMLIGVLIWKEAPSAIGGVGAVLVLAAAWIVARAPLSETAARSPALESESGRAGQPEPCEVD